MRRAWRLPWRTAAWPAAILAVALLIGLLTGPARTVSALDPGSAHPDGMRALVLYLAQSGWRVRTQVDDPGQVPPRQGVLFVPQEVLARADGREARTLADWAGQGGLLVLLGPAETGPLQTPPLLEAAGQTEFVLDEGAPTLGGAHSLFTPVGARWNLHGPRPAQGWQVVAPVQGFPLLAARSASADGGPGRVVALADPMMLDNQALPRADNLAFALALMEDGRRTEWGYFTGDPMAALRAQLMGGEGPHLPLSWRLLLRGLALAAVAGFWVAGRRTGPALPPSPQPSRPGVEFLVAQAHAYRRAGAASGALAYLLRAFRRDLARRTGLPPAAPTAALAGAAAGLGLDPAEVNSLLTRAEGGLDRRLSDKQLLALAHELAAMQRRMHDARSRCEDRRRSAPPGPVRGHPGPGGRY